MSAYIVGDDTLDLIASFLGWNEMHSSGDMRIYVDADIAKPRNLLGFVSKETFTPGSLCYTLNSGDRETVKEELLLENIASVAARYGSVDDVYAGTHVPFRYVSREQADLKDVFGAIRCYQYQACESDTWEKSFAYALTEALLHKAARMISEGLWDFDRGARLSQARAKMQVEK